MKPQIKATGIVATTLLVSGLVGCVNLFGWMDSPGGDFQNLSRARACFDKGDFSCALEHYQALSAGFGEVKASEEAFLILAQNGADMAAFASAVGNGGGVSSFTKMAQKMINHGASATTRAALYEAYLKTADISGDVPLRGLVRLAASLALVGEILAEDATAMGSTTYSTSDLADSPTTCAADAGSGTCTADCALTGSIIVTHAAYDFVASPPATIAGTPDWSMVNGFITALNYALNTEIAAGGKIGDGLGGFSDTVLTLLGTLATTDANCYRSGLLSVGFGGT